MSDQSPPSPPPPPLYEADLRDRRRALIIMFVAAILFSLMGAATKAVTRSGGEGGTAPPLSGSEVAFSRYVFGILALLVIGPLTGTSLLGNDRKGLLVRGVIGGVSSVLFFVGIQHTTLTNATLLNYTSIIFAPLFAVFALKERLTGRGVAAIAVALVGVLLVTRPQFGTVRFGDAMALLSGILSGGAIVQIRRLRQGESSQAVFFYFNLFGLPVSLLTLWVAREPLLWPTPAQWWLVLAIGATSVSAQLLMTYGYRVMTAAQGSLISLSAVVYAALWAYFLFQEPLPPATIAGGLLILFAAALLVVSSQRRAA